MDSEEQNEAKVLAEGRPQAAKISGTERFVPAGIDHPRYQGLRIRKWEIYQVEALRISFANSDMLQPEDIVITDENHKKMAQILTTCLAKEHRNGLARPGSFGLQQIEKQVSRDDLAMALKTACELSGVFDGGA